MNDWKERLDQLSLMFAAAFLMSLMFAAAFLIAWAVTSRTSCASEDEPQSVEYGNPNDGELAPR